MFLLLPGSIFASNFFEKMKAELKNLCAKIHQSVVIQSDMGEWQQIDPVEGATWNGMGDEKFTITFMVPAQTPPELTQGRLLIITNYDGVTKAGNFYFDNVRLLGPEEPAEPNKLAEPNKP